MAKKIKTYLVWWELHIECKKCLMIKHCTLFPIDKRNTYWYSWKCMECRKARRDIWYKENIDELRSKNRERMGVYYIKNKDVIKDKVNKYKEKNPDKVRKRSKKHRVKRREKLVLKKKIYNSEHSKELLKKMYERRRKKWYAYIHEKTGDFIKKHNLRPSVCSICGSEWQIEAHHPNYSFWNEIVFVCKSCHSNIHLWYIECPEPIDIKKII